MYEQMRNELQAKLVDSFGSFEVQQILFKLDAVAVKYEITTKETALTVYNPDELPAMVKAYIASCVVAGMSDKTIIRKNQILGIFFRDIRKPPAEVSTNDVRMWMFDYQQRRGISNRSLDGYRGCIRAFFQWAVDEEYLMRNPCAKIQPIKYEYRQRQALSMLELEQFRRACVTDRELAIVDFLYSTGCRVSELCNMKKSDIDWATNKVVLFGKGKKERESYLNARSICSVRKYLSTRSDIDHHLFVSDYYPHEQLKKESVEAIIRNIEQRANIQGKHITPHVIRHTTATQMVRSGVPIQEVQTVLGHSSVATTMIYAHCNNEDVQRSHQKAVI